MHRREGRCAAGSARAGGAGRLRLVAGEALQEPHSLASLPQSPVPPTCCAYSWTVSCGTARSVFTAGPPSKVGWKGGRSGGIFVQSRWQRRLSDV
jgi:hypothetical protein